MCLSLARAIVPGLYGSQFRFLVPSSSSWCQHDHIVRFDMTEGLRKPKPLSFEGNVTLNWKNFFFQEVELFIAAAHRKNSAGREAIEKEKSFVYAPAVRSGDNTKRLPAESRESIAVLKRKFTDLRILESTCEFGALKDELIRDKIICGVTSSFVRKQL